MSTRVKDAGEFFEAEIATFDRFWQCQFPSTGLSCIQASDIGVASAENVDFVVIQTHLHFVFDRTQSNQAFHVDTAAGDGRSSARTSPCLRNPMEA
jgi:hypothetical protein